MASQRLCQVMGDDVGPMSSVELRNLAQRGAISADTSQETPGPVSFLRVMLLAIPIAFGLLGCGSNDEHPIADRTPETIPLSKRDIHSGTPGEIASLMEQTLSSNPADRSKAAKELRRFGNRAVPAIPFLIRLLGDDEQVEEGIGPFGEAYVTLRDLGEPAVQPLIAGVANKGLKGRDHMVALLSYFEDVRAVPAIIFVLHDKDPKVRREAAIALSYMPDVCAVEPLISLLKDKEPEVVGVAAGALGAIGDRRAVEPLIAVLANRGKPNLSRSAVACALGNIADSRGFAPLFAVINDDAEDDNIRAYALGAIGFLKDSRAFEPLRAALKSKNYRVRLYAVGGLANLGDPRCLPLLVPLLRSPSESTDFRKGVASALVGSEANDAIDAVIDQFDATNVNLPLRPYLADVLAMSPKPRAYMRAVTAMLHDKDPDIRKEVARLLATSVSLASEHADGGSDREKKSKLPALKDAQVLQALMTVVQNHHESDRTREYARMALRKSGNSQALDFLKGEENGGT